MAVNVKDLNALNGSTLPSNKLTVDKIRNEVLTISKYTQIENYYAVEVEEYDDSFLFSPSSLTKAINTFGADIIGNKFKLLDSIKIKGGKSYSPIEFVE